MLQESQNTTKKCSQKLTDHYNLTKIKIISFEKKSIYKMLFTIYIINYPLNYHNL